MTEKQESIFAVICEELTNTYLAEEVKIETYSNIKDLGLDSLDLVELIATLENHYDITILDTNIVDFIEVDDIVKHVETLIS